MSAERGEEISLSSPVVVNVDNKTPHAIAVAVYIRDDGELQVVIYEAEEFEGPRK